MPNNLAKKSHLLILAMIFQIALSSACSTGHLRVASTPSDAQVVAILPGGQERALGKTPFDAPFSKVLDECKDPSSGGLCRLEVQKKGFTRESVYFGSSAFKTHLELNFTLVPATDWMDLEKSEAFNQRMNEVSHSTAKVQEWIFKRDYTSALDAAIQFSQRYPAIAVGWDLLGNVYYLKKMYPQAIEAYQKSIAINPANVDTNKILNVLKDELEKSK
jgi:tetratricopeptide (TPR) repeat protein